MNFLSLFFRNPISHRQVEVRTTTEEGHLSTHDFIRVLIEFFSRAGERKRHGGLEAFMGNFHEISSLERCLVLDLLTFFSIDADESEGLEVRRFKVSYSRKLLSIIGE